MNYFPQGDASQKNFVLPQKRVGITILFWLLPVLFLVVFFYAPIYSTFNLAFSQGMESSLSNVPVEKILKPLRFTFFQAGLSTLLTLVIGLPAAYLFSRFLFPLKSILRSLTMIPFILPTVVVAAGFNALLGSRGWLNLIAMDLLHLESPPIQVMNTLAAIVLAHIFYNTTIVIRVVGSAWIQMDPKLEQAGRVLGASPLKNFKEITLPLLFPSILASTLLVFLFDFTSFGVILLMGGPQYTTLEVEIYLQAMHLLNLPLAAILSAIQMGCTLLVAILAMRVSGGYRFQLIPRLKGEGMRRPKTLGEKTFVVLMAISIFLLLLAPLLSLGLRSFTRLEADRGERGVISTGLTLAYYQELFINRRGSLFYAAPSVAIANSMAFAGMTVVFSLAIGLFATIALERRSRLNHLLNPLLMLPLGTSAVTLGLGMILFFNQPGLNFLSNPILLPLAHSLVALPFVIRTIQPALASIPVTLKQAASVLGAAPFQVWREVTLPIVGRAGVVGGLFAFTISLGEFGATSFLARPEYPTMPIAISRFLSLPGALNYGQAMAMATILMVICGICVLLIEKIEQGLMTS